MENIRCQEIEGAIYAFPEIKFNDRIIEYA